MASTCVSSATLYSKETPSLSGCSALWLAGQGIDPDMTLGTFIAHKVGGRRSWVTRWSGTTPIGRWRSGRNKIAKVGVRSPKEVARAPGSSSKLRHYHLLDRSLCLPALLFRCGPSGPESYCRPAVRRRTTVESIRAASPTSSPTVNCRMPIKRPCNCPAEHAQSSEQSRDYEQKLIDLKHNWPPRPGRPSRAHAN